MLLFETVQVNKFIRTLDVTQATEMGYSWMEKDTILKIGKVIKEHPTLLNLRLRQFQLTAEEFAEIGNYWLESEKPTTANKESFIAAVGSGNLQTSDLIL